MFVFFMIAGSSLMMPTTTLDMTEAIANVLYDTALLVQVSGEASLSGYRVFIYNGVSNTGMNICNSNASHCMRPSINLLVLVVSDSTTSLRVAMLSTPMMTMSASFTISGLNFELIVWIVIPVNANTFSWSASTLTLFTSVSLYNWDARLWSSTVSKSITVMFLIPICAKHMIVVEPIHQAPITTTLVCSKSGLIISSWLWYLVLLVSVIWISVTI